MSNTKYKVGDKVVLKSREECQKIITNNDNFFGSTGMYVFEENKYPDGGIVTVSQDQTHDWIDIKESAYSLPYCFIDGYAPEENKVVDEREYVRGNKIQFKPYDECIEIIKEADGLSACDALEDAYQIEPEGIFKFRLYADNPNHFFIIESDYSFPMDVIDKQDDKCHDGKFNNTVDSDLRQSMDEAIQDTDGRREFETGSVRDSAEGKNRHDLISPFAMQRLARHCKDGAVKYGDHNWMKGQPNSDIFKSLFRHFNAYQSGKVDEDHLTAMFWNTMALLHNEEVAKLKGYKVKIDGVWQTPPNLVDFPIFKQE